MRTMHSAEYKRFLVKLKQARQDAKLIQQEVADALGIPQSRVARMESGVRQVNVIELEALAILYKKPLKWFVPPRKPG